MIPGLAPSCALSSKLKVDFLTSGRSPNTTHPSAYTFANQPLGKAAAGRRFVIGASHYDGGNSMNRSIIAVSIAGQPCVMLRGLENGYNDYVSLWLSPPILPGRRAT